MLVEKGVVMVLAEFTAPQAIYKQIAGDDAIEEIIPKKVRKKKAK